MVERVLRQECIVTGAAGFIGGHLTRRLFEAGRRVTGVDNFFSGRVENMAPFFDHPLFTFHEADIREPGLLARLLPAGPANRFCFHFAAIASVPYSLDHPEETMRVNHEATVALLGEASRLGFCSFVFAGSAAEYGRDQRTPLLEEYTSDDTRHLSPYGRAKFLASRAVGANPRGAALRFFNVYGPGQDSASPYSGVISRFIEMAGAGKKIRIFGDGLQTRDFIYITDVVDACLLAAGLEDDTAAVPHGIYNIGTGRSATLLDLAGAIRDLFGGGPGDTFEPARGGDIKHSLAGVEKFEAVTGWRAGVDLREGLKRMIPHPPRTGAKA